MPDSDKIQFKDEDPIIPKLDEMEKGENWLILIVDDEKDVHKITELVLQDIKLDGRGVRFISAYSGKEAKKLISANPDIAVMFLDVVMETDDAGLQVAKYVRETLGNKFMRIILRTGQPGVAPEKDVILNYDINDYKEKSELVAKKLFSVVISSLRAYQNVKQVDDLRNNLQKMVDEQTIELKNEIIERKKIEEDLYNAKNVAEAANQVKSLFLANMSHELRTPLSAIIGYSQILQRDGELNKECQRLVGVVEDSGKHLLEIINDILDISKIEAGRMELLPVDFDLIELINELSHLFKLKCSEKRLKWLVEFDNLGEKVHVNGDRKKIKQVLINLLANAFKFTKKGYVKLSVRNNGDEYYLFSVADTGHGIELEEQNMIFEPFVQAKEGISSGGTGLGLSISSKQVEIMGGKLQFETKIGRGTCFFFSIPINPSKGRIKPESETSLLDNIEDGIMADCLDYEDEFSVVNPSDDDKNDNLLLNVSDCEGFAEVHECLIYNMKVAAEFNMVSKFEKYLDEFEKIGPETEKFTTKLRELVNVLDMSGILKVLDRLS